MLPPLPGRRGGDIICVALPGGYSLTYDYNDAGQLGICLNRRYNVTDQVTDEQVTRDDSNHTLSTTTFRYDTLCRLVEAKNDAATVTYEYDGASRLIAETSTADARSISMILIVTRYLSASLAD